MLEILIEKKMLFPLILFVAVYAAGTAEEKEKREKITCRE